MHEGQRVLTDLTHILDSLAELIAERLASHRGEDDPPKYYDAKHNPLSSRRAFLAAARRGEFPSFLVGKQRLALRADVDAWVLAQRRPPPIEKPRALTDRELLARAGVRLAGDRR